MQETQTGTNGAAKKMQLNVPVSGRSFIVSLDNGFFEATVSSSITILQYTGAIFSTRM